MDRTNNIDQYFKSNLDRIEVSFNETHWEKLQQSLLVAEGAMTGAEVVKKQIFTLKTVLISVGIALVSAVVVYLLFSDSKQKQPQFKHPNQIITPSKTDSVFITTPNSIKKETIPTRGLDTLNKRTNVNKTDSTIKSKVFKTLKDSLEEDNFIFW